MVLQPKGVKIALADPDGSGVHGLYTTGKPNGEGSSISEGIGQGRITANLEGFKLRITALRSPTPRHCR